MWGSLGFAGYAAGWTIHKDHAQSVLLHHAVRPSRGSAHGTTTASKPCVQSSPAPGQLAGVLTVPAIGLEAPVEEGTSEAVLSVAAGHVPSTVWPGAAGTSVLLAHDVSYFVHLNALKPGDVVRYRNQCTTVDFSVTGKRVVHAGDAIPNSTGPELVLDTCWPTNALFYTSQRLLVRAREVGAPTRSGSPGGGALPPRASTVSYHVPAPPGLVSQGLTLQQNEEPMGTMTLTGDPSPSWEESPGPLALEAATLEAYFGGIHAAGQRRSDWWSAIAPGVPMPSPLTGAHIAGNDAPLDVTIDSSGGTPRTVTLTTDVTLSGGPAPGRYHQVVTASVSGQTVTLQSWEMSHG